MCIQSLHTFIVTYPWNAPTEPRSRTGESFNVNSADFRESGMDCIGAATHVCYAWAHKKSRGNSHIHIFQSVPALVKKHNDRLIRARGQSRRRRGARARQVSARARGPAAHARRASTPRAPRLGRAARPHDHVGELDCVLDPGIRLRSMELSACSKTRVH